MNFIFFYQSNEISLLIYLMNKVIQAKLKQSSKQQFLFYYPYLSLTQQLGIVPKKINRRKKSHKKKSPQLKKWRESSNQKSKKTQTFIRYLSKSSNKNNTPIIHEIQPYQVQVKTPKKVNNIKRYIKSATCRTNEQSLNLYSTKTRFQSQQLIKTQVIIPNSQQFVIPGIKFKKQTRNQTQQYHSSPSKYQIQKMINIQGIIQRTCKNFSQFMIEFYKRANISHPAMIFVFNSEDIWFKNVLLSRGWIENPNKDSRAYHLSWSYKLPKIQPFSQQLVNHYSGTDSITSKYRLKQNLQFYNCAQIQPLTFDLSTQKENFIQQFKKREFIMRLEIFLNLFEFDYKEYNQSYEQISVQIKETLKSNLIQQSKLTTSLLQVISQSIRLIQNQSCFQELLFLDLNNQIKKVEQLNQSEQKSITLIKKLHNFIKKSISINHNFSNIWILKSRIGSKGKGIILSNNLSQIIKNQTKIVQRYIQNPLLLNKINHHKFDIRLWVLVYGCKKVSVYYYKQFYGRISSQAYTSDLQSIKNQLIHLTNYSVNKNKYTQNGNCQDSVIFNNSLFNYIKQQYDFDYKEKFYKDVELVLKKLKPIFQNQVCIDKTQNRFELFGFDFLIDSEFKLHLLEINLSAKCDQRNERLSQILKNMSQGLLDIIEKKSSVLRNWILIS